MKNKFLLTAGIFFLFVITTNAKTSSNPENKEGNDLTKLTSQNFSINKPVQQNQEPLIKEITTPQYFAVLVKDVDRYVEWYSSVFGLNKLGGSRAKDGLWRIENLKNEKLLVEIIRDNRARETDRTLGFRKVGFYVPDVRSVSGRIARLNGEAPKVIDFPEFGVQTIQIRDPENNLIQLFSKPDKKMKQDSSAVISKNFSLKDLAKKRMESGKPFLKFLDVSSMEMFVYSLPAGGVDKQTPHKLDEVYYVTEGKAELQVENKNYNVSPGSIVFVKRGAKHKFHSIKKDLTVIVFFSTAESR